MTEERKDGKMEGGRKKGRKEGRKEGRNEGRMEGRRRTRRRGVGQHNFSVHPVERKDERRAGKDEIKDGR